MYFIQPGTHEECRQCTERETARQHLRRRRRRETRAHRRQLDVRRSTALSAPNVREARNFGGRSGVLVLWSRQRSPWRRLRECWRVSGSAGARACAIERGSGAHAGRVDSVHQACAASTSACAEDCAASYNTVREGGVGGPRPRKSIRGPCGDPGDGSTASSRSITTRQYRCARSAQSSCYQTRTPVDSEHASGVTG
ncbi:hypothetical protein C8J57DRAFT_1378344, partial [Mycena rebaudengoi]